MTRHRFAPSPTGYLHLGHARAAAECFGDARAVGGVGLLRIEDIDHTRCRPEFEAAIYEDLRWLGFDWPEPVRRQSEHLDDYRQVIETLTARGLTYEDRRTRSGKIDPDRPPAIRLSIAKAKAALQTEHLAWVDDGQPRQIEISALSDPTIARRDIGVSYHIAVTHDDWLQEITHITRGEDLRDETPIHVLIQILMGWPVPHYRHHGLVMEADGKKMSKRRGSMTIRSLREAGKSADGVLELAGVS